MQKAYFCPGTRFPFENVRTIYLAKRKIKFYGDNTMEKVTHYRHQHQGCQDHTHLPYDQIHHNTAVKDPKSPTTKIKHSVAIINRSINQLIHQLYLRDCCS